jgi:hypothetical protein
LLHALPLPSPRVCVFLRVLSLLPWALRPWGLCVARAILRDWAQGRLANDDAQAAALKSARKQTIINFSINYGIVTEHTSFIAVEKRTVERQRLEIDCMANSRAHPRSACWRPAVVQEEEKQGRAATPKVDLVALLHAASLDRLEKMTYPIPLALQEQVSGPSLASPLLPGSPAPTQPRRVRRCAKRSACVVWRVRPRRPWDRT